MSNLLFQRAVMLPLLAGMLLWAWASWVPRPTHPPAVVEAPPEPQPVLGEKTEFIQRLSEIVAAENAVILRERKWLLQLARKARPSDEEVLRVEGLAEQYRIKDLSQSTTSLIAELLVRVDVVPASLALAQAANESAWGRSRFAREGNNLFGIWCFTQGCGIVPKNRNKGATHEVAHYDSIAGSVRDYLWNLNAHPSYAMLRDLRMRERQAGRELTATALAPGLMSYSELGSVYIHRIEAIVFANDLERFDRTVQQSSL